MSNANTLPPQISSEQNALTTALIQQGKRQGTDLSSRGKRQSLPHQRPTDSANKTLTTGANNENNRLSSPSVQLHVPVNLPLPTEVNNQRNNLSILPFPFTKPANYERNNLSDSLCEFRIPENLPLPTEGNNSLSSSVFQVRNQYLPTEENNERNNLFNSLFQIPEPPYHSLPTVENNEQNNISNSQFQVRESGIQTLLETPSLPLNSSRIQQNSNIMQQAVNCQSPEFQEFSNIVTSRLRVPDLHQLLSKFGLPKKGRKADHTSRIITYVSNNPQYLSQAREFAISISKARVRGQLVIPYESTEKHISSTTPQANDFLNYQMAAKAKQNEILKSMNFQPSPFYKQISSLCGPEIYSRKN